MEMRLSIFLVVLMWTVKVESHLRDDEIINIHTLKAGMQLLQGISMTNIAALLNISSNQLKTVRFSLDLEATSHTQLRLALDTTCRIHERVVDVMGLQEEKPDDIEINTLLLLLEQHQKDSCHWLARTSQTDYSVCSAEILQKICFHHEALIISENAEQGLLDYITRARITVDEWLSKHITTISLSEIILNYFSSNS